MPDDVPVRLFRMNELQVLLLMIGISAVIFGYQKWQEGIFAKDAIAPRDMEVGIRNPFRTKRKAR